MKSANRPATEAADPSTKTMVGSVVHAVAVIRYLANGQAEKGVTLIAGDLGISPSSCFNILKTLVAERLVEFDSKRKTYCIGAGLMDLARQLVNQPSLAAFIAPVMHVLADRHSVAVGLWRLTGDRPVLVELAETVATTRIHLTIGQQLPPLAGAVGRSIAAMRNLPDKAMRELLLNVPWQKEVSVELYRAQLVQAREKGYAVDADYFIRGVTTVAAPVLDRTGAVRYCVSATAFSAQLTPEHLHAAGDDIVVLANRASNFVSTNMSPY